MEDYKPQSRLVIWWVVFLIVLIVGIAVAVVLSNQEPSPVDNLGAAGQAGRPPSDFEPQLILTSQEAGSVVYLEEVQVDQGAWVAIQQDRDGSPGDILGAGYFDATVSAGAVELGQPLIAGRTYYAVLYHDSQADQNFDQAVELPWLSLSGQPIIITFVVNDSLEEEKG